MVEDVAARSRNAHVGHFAFTIDRDFELDGRALGPRIAARIRRFDELRELRGSNTWSSARAEPYALRRAHTIAAAPTRAWDLRFKGGGLSNASRAHDARSAA
ncbi:hypothetical protein AKJ09_02721 [Labilithrix luteola]|uniref:Uncharacterized protein n=1 Tax=Labilithrix luteola TaxID=1391654 RepID=A0A0K1PRA9_9BACT|nr:hypothetical protein AKJ09_02721 [Labilithrix luteola]